MTFEHPVRFPPPLSRSKLVDGIRVPVMERPFIECGEKVQLGGVWVVCIRRKGHPMFINYAHSNGYSEWCFDAAIGQSVDTEGVTA